MCSASRTERARPTLGAVWDAIARSPGELDAPPSQHDALLLTDQTRQHRFCEQLSVVRTHRSGANNV